MKIAIIRGSYLNKFEFQNYEPLIEDYKLVGFSGTKSLHQKFSFPVIKLWSPVDLPNFPNKMAILNRLWLGDAMYLYGLEEELKGYDIVHVRETYFHFTQQALNAKAKGLVKKVVCTCSETIPFNHEGIWRRKSYKKRAIKEVDLFHCLTNKAKDCLITEGCNSKKILVFPYGIDLVKFKCQMSNVKTKCKTSKVINLLFVGRLVKEKGVYDLLKVFIKLNKKYSNLQLTMVGNGEEKDNLIRLIGSINPSRQIEIKQVGYDQMPLVYQNADIFCLLSKPTKYWEEYFGMALIEAMVSGLPIISTDCGAISEVLGDKEWIIKPGGWQEAVNKIDQLIKNRSLRKLIGLKNYKRAIKYFDSQKVAKNIKGFWEKAIK